MLELGKILMDSAINQKMANNETFSGYPTAVIVLKLLALSPQKTYSRPLDFL